MKPDIWKQFLRYVSLGILGMLSQSFYILADTFFIANGLGADGLTALNLVLPVYSLINASGLMIGMGGAIRYSYCSGQGRQDDANRVFTTGCVLAGGIGLIILVAGVPSCGFLVRILGAEGAVADMAFDYLHTVLLFCPAFLLNQTMLCFVRNDKAPRLAMVAVAGGSLVNTVLDYVFLFPLSWGMFGAAFATCLAPVISLCILSFHWTTGKYPALRPDTRSIINTLRTNVIGILSAGAPSFVTEFSAGTIILIFNYRILGISGNTAVAAYGITANLALVAAAVFTGIAQGTQPLLGRACAAKDSVQAKGLFRASWAIALAVGGLICLVGMLFPGPVVSLFNESGDPLLAAEAERAIRCYFPAFLLLGFNITATGYLSSMMRERQAFIVSAARGLVLVVFFVSVLPMMFGLTGIWLSVPAAEAGALLLALAFLHKRPSVRKSKAA